MKFFRWSKYLVEIIKDTYKKHPIRIGIFFTCVLLLIMVEGWDYFAPLPAHDWIATNLRKIRVRQVNNFCFAVFGDNKNSHNTFQVLLQYINQDPDIAFAIDLGDLVFDGEKEKYRYFFDQVRASLQLPLLTVIGNHELRGKGRGLYYDIFGPFYYSFQIGDNYFIVLDNANEIGLDQWQRHWLEKELKEAQFYNNLFIFMHVPLFDPRGNSYHHCLPKEEADSLITLFRKYNVTHIFCAHLHGYFTGQWQGIPYTISGGAGAELFGSDPKHYFYHYLKVHVKGDKVNIHIQPVPSPNYDRLGRILYVAWLYLSAFMRFHAIELTLFLIIIKLVISTLKRPETK